MGKLKKPRRINEILIKGIVLKSAKAYTDITGFTDLRYKCAVRSKWHKSIPFYMTRESLYDENVPCHDISTCMRCFLQAKNYLNVLKYIKQNNINN